MMRPAPGASPMSPCSPSIPQPNRYVPCGGRYEVSCGVIELPGARNSMEDRTSSSVEDDHAFFGVFDGHGGSSAAEYCQDNLHNNLKSEMQVQWNRETPLLRTNDAECVQKISHCIREAFVNCDRQFLSSQRPQGGTTAVVAVLINGVVVVGNVGDSRAVLCRAGRAIPLSQDHTVKRADEVQRVLAVGGRVVADEVVVNGEEFCLTRAIGDSMVKVPAGWDFRDPSAPQVVTSEPEVSITELVADDHFIVLASDGIWDRMSNDAVVQYVQNSLRTTSQHDPTLAAQDLAQHCIFNLKTSDNVSVVIILPRKLNCRPLNFANAPPVLGQYPVNQSW
eukprot:TRINITY_DN5515_c0_g1_i1.p1 TRINITY_DN5515_c0_g1~~TRINITY_DN5515_c0_g1_i1.p1  ORF type:complete len:336 (-),score=44.84 TRINITY_DN5515_c0_g1_i1:183-1190(-)